MRERRSFGWMARVGALAALAALPACHRKNRLTNNYFTFSITPPAATVVKNSPLTLTANTGGVDVNPTWEITPQSAGSLVPAVGRTVVFTPTALGDVQIFATVDGTQAKSQIAVVTYIPPTAVSSTAPTTNVYSVYSDQGIPVSSLLGTDIFASTGLDLQELSTGYTPEGIKYERTTGATNGAFWGVAYDIKKSGARVDLSAYSAGTLKFSLRLGRTMGPTEKIEIHIDDDGTGGSPGKVDNIATDFMNELSTDWQEISIPISSFAPAQTLSTIDVPFAIVVVNVSSPLTFDVDAVRWEK